ncbi:MAG: RadC family protein [Polyangiaceae bacterium]
MLEAQSTSQTLASPNSLAHTAAHPPPQTQPMRVERRLLVSPGEQTDLQLLSGVLGSTRTGPDAEELAQCLLSECGGLPGVRRLGVAGLIEFGLLEGQALRLLSALELGARSLLSDLGARRQRLDHFEAVVDWARPRLAALDHEEVWLLTLDGQNGLIQSRRVAQGGLHGCALLPRDVLRPALRDAASAFILVHNHPSGDPTPSPDDVDMTRHLVEAARLMGTPLLDHIVVARGGAASMLDLGVV